MGERKHDLAPRARGRRPTHPRTWALVFSLAALFLPQPAHAQTNSPAAQPSYLMTKLNTADLQRSVDFYTKIIGLKVAQRVDTPRFAQALLNFGGENFEATLILHHEKGRKEPFQMGSAFNNVGFAVPDIEAVAKRLTDAGYSLTQPIAQYPSPVPFAKTLSVAFTKDPDGFTIELVHWNR